jgi:hypothetical protein
MTFDKNAFLSKSIFLRGLRCYKSLYLHKYQPELRDEVPEFQNSLLESGMDVGMYARKLFPDGIEIPFDGMSIAEQIDKTEKAIDAGATTLYEAAFNYDDVFIKADILHKGKGGWEIYEVKSSTSVKDYHPEDIAVQYYVIKGIGLPVSKACLAHINNQYVRNREIEVDELFAIVDLTDSVIEKQDFIKDEIEKMRDILKGSMPDIDIGDHCSEHYDCDFKGHCWKHIPENSIFSIESNWIDKFSYYRQGIVHFEDLPMNELNNKQRMYVEAFLEKKDFVEREGVENFLSALWYPMYFLDFETFYTPIPLYDGIRPYQQIPFQYSLHYIENKGANPKHSEYVAAPNCDPRKELLEKLLAEIPTNACVIVYNQTFEKGVLKGLAEAFPAYADWIVPFIENIRDLMVPFRRKALYHWQMYGSHSIKAVLPALIPELSYEGLEIADGGMAMDAYFQMCGSKDHEEIEKIRASLLEYCRLDTLAMVRILERLYKLK